MSIFDLLLKRAESDQGIENFLQKVFIYRPSCLKTAKLVCRKWCLFIDDQIWSNKLMRSHLKTVLNKNLKFRPIQETTINLNLSFIRGVHDLVKVISDDEVALIDVSTIDEAQMILVNLYHSQTKFMKLGGFDGSKGERLLMDVGDDFYCTAFSHRKSLMFWSKSGSLKTVSKINPIIAYIRRIQIFGKLVVAICKGNIFILTSFNFDVLPLHNLDIPEQLGTSRSVAHQSINPSQFLVSHDHVVNCWDLMVNKNYPVMTFNTGLVVDMVARHNILFTVGSMHCPGFTLWNLVSGQKIKSLLVENIFFAVRLKGNHLLLNGNSQLRYVINFENLSLDQCESSFVDGDSECEEICDVSQTKFFMVKASHESELVTIDFWNYFRMRS